jgi:anthranilate/para-aminobenzoate synthase component I
LLFFFKISLLLSATPERYLRKEGDLLISQPIKGTAKRFSDPIEDEIQKKQLALDQRTIRKHNDCGFSS